jgi:pimeloyl-ACP methyl ester carboxylesterase
MRMPQLDVNGLKIEFDTFGNDSGEAILLIMGLGAQMTTWSPEFCEALAKHGHYVIRFDNRDVGLSTKLDGARSPHQMRYALNYFMKVPLGAPYTIRDMASDAAGVLDALSISTAHVVGASMGGIIAQLMAVHYPQRVKTLTSIMSTSGARGLPQARRDVMQHIFMKRPKVGGRNALLEHSVQSMKMIASPGFPRSEQEWRVLLSASLARSYYPQGFQRQLAAVVSDGSRVERLKKISRPTLVIHGREDPLVPVACGVDTARHIDGARLEIIEGMGHDIPPQLIDKLTNLIASHVRDSA